MASMRVNHRATATATSSVPETDMLKPTNQLQSNFEETSSMDSDERYLVRAR